MTVKSLLLAACLSLLCAISLTAQSPESFSGTVFEDKNANGIRDKGEKGLSGVAVSDGFSVTVTDGDGAFSIKPAGRARFIAVYTPDGWRNTNRFFCDVRGIMSGKGLSGTELNRSNPGLDFGLSKTKVYGKFIHMSDIEDREYMDWIDRIKEYAALHTIDFMVVTGDICYESGLKFFTQAMNDDNVGRRVVYTIGNHDLIKGNEDYLGNSYGEKNYEDCFGPSWYSFNAAGMHFIVTPMLMGDARPSYSADDIRAWIQQDLAAVADGTPVIMFNHDAAQQLVPDNANVRAFVYGHRHYDLRTIDDKGVLYYCSMAPSKASNDHSASAFREFSYNVKGDITTRMHYAPITNHVVAHEVGGVVRAVVYDAACEPVMAEVVLPDGSRKPMRQISDMMWEAKLPSALPAGAVYKVAADFSDGEKIITPQRQEPGLKWMTTLPCKTYFTDPVISGGHLYIAGMDNENGRECAVFSLDASTGRIEWSVPTLNSVKGDIALSNGVIYAGDVDYNIYAIDAADGSVKWSRRIDKSMYPSFTEGVLVKDGLVYMGSAGALCALDASTGETVWTNKHKHGSITNVCTNRIADGALLANGYWVGRFCYDASTGEFLWEKKDYHNRYSSCTPLVIGDTFLYTGYGAIMQVKARTGEVVKSAEFPYIFNTRSEPLVANGKIFVGTSNSGFLAVDMETMKQAWNFLCGPAVIYTSPYTKNREKTVESSPAAFGDKVVFGANDGYVYCLNQENGRFVWRIKVGLPVISKPQIIGNLMFVSDFGGNIYCYQIH